MHQHRGSYDGRQSAAKGYKLGWESGLQLKDAFGWRVGVTKRAMKSRRGGWSQGTQTEGRGTAANSRLGARKGFGPSLWKAARWLYPQQEGCILQLPFFLVIFRVPPSLTLLCTRCENTYISHWLPGGVGGEPKILRGHCFINSRNTYWAPMTWSWVGMWPLPEHSSPVRETVKHLGACWRGMGFRKGATTLGQHWNALSGLPGRLCLQMWNSVLAVLLCSPPRLANDKAETSETRAWGHTARQKVGSQVETQLGTVLEPHSGKSRGRIFVSGRLTDVILYICTQKHTDFSPQTIKTDSFISSPQTFHRKWGHLDMNVIQCGV